MKPPGTGALAFASRWFDPATVHRTFEPLIADWQREWLEAPRSRRPLVTARGFAGLATALIVCSPSVLRTPVPAALSNRIASRIALVVGIVASLLMTLVVMNLRPSDPRGISLVFNLPPAIALAFPFAMTAAVDAIRKHAGLSSQVERSAALKLGAFAVAFMLVFTGWVVPASSRAWSVAMTPPGTGEPLRTVGQLNTWELIAVPSRATVYAQGTALPSQSTIIRRERNMRAILPALPVVLLWLRWGVRNRRDRKWYAPLPTAPATVATMVVVAALWVAGVRMELQRLAPLSLGLWLAPMTLIAAGILGRFNRQREALS